MRPLAFALSFGAFCAVAGASMAAPERPGDALQAGNAFERASTTGSGESAAVAALLDSVDQELAAERPQQAVALLERALRIEPRNPALWHYLGLANLALGNNAQAEAMAAKSRSLAGGNRTLRTRNDQLMAAALRAQGKPVLPASRVVPSVASRTSVNEAFQPAATYAGARGVYEQPNRVEQRRSSLSAARREPPRLRAPSVAPPAREQRLAERDRRERARAVTPRSAPRAERRSARRYGSNGYAL